MEIVSVSERSVISRSNIHLENKNKHEQLDAYAFLYATCDRFVLSGLIS